MCFVVKMVGGGSFNFFFNGSSAPQLIQFVRIFLQLNRICAILWLAAPFADIIRHNVASTLFVASTLPRAVLMPYVLPWSC